MRIERIDLIKDYIIKNKSATIDELCEKFNVSKNTIRRDINVLAEDGIISKVYGGVVSNSKDTSEISYIKPFNERTVKNNDIKIKIAKAAASYVEDNDTIFIDSGTTTINMIPFLKDINNLTVITYSIPIIVSCMKYNNIKVISLPGILLRSTFSITSAFAIDFLNNFNINKAFMACTGINLKNEVTNATYEEYEIKKHALSKSHKCYLLADNSKFGKNGMMTYCVSSEFDTIITDMPINRDFSKSLAGTKIDIASLK